MTSGIEFGILSPMNLFAIKVTFPCDEFEYPKTDVFVVLAGYSGEAINTFRASGKIGADSGTVDHCAVIAENVTIPGITYPTTLY